MLLKLENIKKNFGSVQVLNGINLELDKGMLLGIVGENGAGKSTLMNIIGGMLQPNDGSIYINDKPYTPTSPQDAQTNGIAFIHQELNIFSNLNVLDNLFLNNYPKKKVVGIPFIDTSLAKETAKNTLEKVGLSIPLNKMVSQLSQAQKQLLEIAKVIIKKPNLIIFDEPTTSLSSYEIEKLFELIAELKNQDIAIIYISHNIEHITQLSDKIAVLRDGTLVYERSKVQGYIIEDIIQKMVGRTIEDYYPKRNSSFGNKTILELKNISIANSIKNVSLQLKEGEILGIYGLIGAGRTETAKAIYGLDEIDEGQVYYNGDLVKNANPQFWIKNGLAYLTEDRREEGLLLDETIVKNIALPSLRKISSGIFGKIDESKSLVNGDKMAGLTKLKYHSLVDQKTGTLSGGNQQKVVLSKWLLTSPKVLIIDEPNKGIDIGAKYEIYQLLNELVSGGASVLMISSEIEELLGMCDRILIFNQGTINGEFTKNNFNRSSILEKALPSSKS
jgi:ribose transport system ATP-binding protein